MRDEDKTEEQLIKELVALRGRCAELEAAEAKRKQAEDALRESEEKFRTLADQSPNMIFINKNGRVVYANRRCEEVMRYTKQEFYAPDFDFLRLIAPEFVRVVKSSYATHVQGGKVEPSEYSLITKKGERIEAIINTRLIDYEGETAILGTVTDITEHKRVEEALREQIIRNELILQTAMDGFFILDLEGSILKANHAASLIIGYSLEELVGMNIRDLEALESPQEITEHIERLMREGSDRFETKHRRKDGQIIDVEVGVNFAEAAEEGFIFCFFHNISKRKRAEEALLERERELEIKTSSLEEVNTALRVLLKRREQDKTELEEKVLFNTKELVMPYVEKLKRSGLDERQGAFVSILESNLNDIVSPFSSRLSSRYLKFTPAEMQVANLVRYGKTTKEIAGLLNVSTQTIDSHRKNIRTKMGLRNKRANLRTHLLSMQT